MRDNVATVSIHNGFENLASLIIGTAKNASWFTTPVNTSILQKYFNENSVNENNIDEFVNDVIKAS